MKKILMKRKGDWIETFTGRQFWPCDPRPADICIDDIAHSLANQCRFGGHAREFYSVAQHSILVCDLVPEPHKLWAIVHDASEAYLIDLPRPIKRGTPLGHIYQQMENRIMAAICHKYQLPRHEPLIVVIADKLALIHEARQFMQTGGLKWNYAQYVPSLAHKIAPLSPGPAEQLFLKIFFQYYKAGKDQKSARRFKNWQKNEDISELARESG